MRTIMTAALVVGLLLGMSGAGGAEERAGRGTPPVTGTGQPPTPTPPTTGAACPCGCKTPGCPTKVACPLRMCAAPTPTPMPTPTPTLTPTPTPIPTPTPTPTPTPPVIPTPQPPTLLPTLPPTEQPPTLTPPTTGVPTHVPPPTPRTRIIPETPQAPMLFVPPGPQAPADIYIKQLGDEMKGGVTTTTQDEGAPAAPKQDKKEECDCEKITLEKKIGQRVKADLKQQKVVVEEVNRYGKRVKREKNMNHVRIEIPYKYTVQCEDVKKRSILCFAEIRFKGEAEWKGTVFDPINNQFKEGAPTPYNEKTGSTPEGKTPEGKDFPGKPCNGPCDGTPKPGDDSVVYEADFSTDSLPLTGTLKYQIEGSGCKENGTLEVTVTVEFKKAPADLAEDMEENQKLKDKGKSYIKVGTKKKTVKRDEKKDDKEEEKNDKPSKPPEK